MNLITIALVLKSGGEYDEEYVTRLRQNVNESLNFPHQFRIFSDIANESLEWLPLELGVEGWWSKVEAFRVVDSPAIYLDLDTILVGNLNPLARAILACDEGTMFMLESFRWSRGATACHNERFASGIMAWKGDFSFIYSGFDPKTDPVRWQWDQRYISHMLTTKGIGPRSVQSVQPGVCSYKHDCREGVPVGASVVCFHGYPRPRDLNWRVS